MDSSIEGRRHQREVIEYELGRKRDVTTSSGRHYDDVSRENSRLRRALEEAESGWQQSIQCAQTLQDSLSRKNADLLSAERQISELRNEVMMLQKQAPHSSVLPGNVLSEAEKSLLQSEVDLYRREVEKKMKQEECYLHDLHTIGANLALSFSRIALSAHHIVKNTPVADDKNLQLKFDNNWLNQYNHYRHLNKSNETNSGNNSTPISVTIEYMNRSVNELSLLSTWTEDSSTRLQKHIKNFQQVADVVPPTSLLDYDSTPFIAMAQKANASTKRPPLTQLPSHQSNATPAPISSQSVDQDPSTPSQLNGSAQGLCKEQSEPSRSRASSYGSDSVYSRSADPHSLQSQSRVSCKGNDVYSNGQGRDGARSKALSSHQDHTNHHADQDNSYQKQQQGTITSDRTELNTQTDNKSIESSRHSRHSVDKKRDASASNQHSDLSVQSHRSHISQLSHPTYVDAESENNRSHQEVDNGSRLKDRDGIDNCAPNSPRSQSSSVKSPNSPSQSKRVKNNSKRKESHHQRPSSARGEQESKTKHAVPQSEDHSTVGDNIHTQHHTSIPQTTENLTNSDKPSSDDPRVTLLQEGATVFTRIDASKTECVTQEDLWHGLRSSALFCAVLRLPMGLASHEDLEASRLRVFKSMKTQYADKITWQEFMSYLLYFKLNSTNDDSKSDNNHNDNGHDDSSSRTKDATDEVEGTSDSVSTNDSNMKKEDVKGEKKLKVTKCGKKKKLYYDAQGHLVGARSKSKGMKGKKGNKQPKENINDNGVTRDGKIHVIGGEGSISVGKDDHHVKSNSYDFPTRAYAIGSKINTGKQGSRHLQLHVFAGSGD